uniref:Uncharacterized protein n=1 Tax=Setaria viridis TaxID=4556 RepID=A0A4U6WBK0_SETVI|nr:hypothetical protein SEVIR_1G217750v2 [Setaria viridis]
MCNFFFQNSALLFFLITKLQTLDILSGNYSITPFHLKLNSAMSSTCRQITVDVLWRLEVIDYSLVRKTLKLVFNLAQI